MKCSTKYPVGTKIKYRPSGLCTNEDVGKCGVIVGYTDGGSVKIVLPNSYIAQEIYNDSSHYFTTHLESLEKLTQPGEQLLFSFMKE